MQQVSGQEGALARRQEHHREGHHDLHAPARGDDEGGRAAAAGLRHRRQAATATPRWASCCSTSRPTSRPAPRWAQAFRKYPQYFDALFCNLVAAGEAAGILDSLLDRLATYKEKILAIKGKIKSALFYPISIIVVALVVTAVIMIFVIPVFKDLFKSFGADLPAPTLVVMAISDFFVGNWWWLFPGIIGGVWFFLYTLEALDHDAGLHGPAGRCACRCSAT